MYTHLYVTWTIIQTQYKVKRRWKRNSFFGEPTLFFHLFDRRFPTFTHTHQNSSNTSDSIREGVKIRKKIEEIFFSENHNMYLQRRRLNAMADGGKYTITVGWIGEKKLFSTNLPKCCCLHQADTSRERALFRSFVVFVRYFFFFAVEVLCQFSFHTLVFCFGINKFSSFSLSLFFLVPSTACLCHVSGVFGTCKYFMVSDWIIWCIEKLFTLNFDGVRRFYFVINETKECQDNGDATHVGIPLECEHRMVHLFFRCMSCLRHKVN